MSAPIDLRPDHAKLVRDILAKHLPAGVSVRVFGSRAKWTAKTHSDLDLALKGAERLPPQVVAALAEAFEDSALPFKVDVLDWRAVAPEFQAVIDRDGVGFFFSRAQKSFGDSTSFVNSSKLSRSMLEWEIRPLSDLIENLDSRRIPVKESDRQSGPYPYYGASGIIDYIDKYIFEGLHLLIAEDGENLRTRTLPIAFLAEDRFWVNNHAHIVRGNNKSDTRFLLYALLSANIVSYLTGSTMPKLTQGNLNRIPILAPCKTEQRAIASVLGALDDKIELNRRMNETLEAMARAIFKDWFVDFGPTRAKMATRGEAPPKDQMRGEDPQNENVARAPYLAPDIWSLFPDRLDADGKPEGWSIEAVYDQAIWVNGAAYKDMHFSSEPDALPVVKIAELKNGITNTTRFTDTDLGERYKIVDGELLFSWSGNPDTSIDTFIWTSGAAWLNQHIFAVRSNGKRSQAFLYTMLKFLRGIFAEIARNKQTTGLGHVTQQDLIRLRITAPSEGALAAFDDVVGTLHSRFISNLFENRSLIAIRDVLLPKLMSGEVRVSDTEKAVEVAT